MRGRLPERLRGTLLRVAPALFHLPHQSYRHWFDGLAQLHRFFFEDGEVIYSCRFVESPDYRRARSSGKIPFPAFATDPCRSLFRRLSSFFVDDATANPNVNVLRLGERFVAVTERPLPIEFDPQTLETLGVVDYEDHLGGSTCTPHPHQDGERYLNAFVRFSRVSEHRIVAESGGPRRTLLASAPADKPSYIHSFGFTSGRAVVAAIPLVVDPLGLLFRNRPFIENFTWEPERGTVFLVFDLASGEVARYAGPPFFCFHVVNAQPDGEGLLVDLVEYPDATVIPAFRLQSLVEGRAIPWGWLCRYRLSGGEASLVWRSSSSLELPRIDAALKGGRYRYCYGVSNRPELPGDLYNRLTRMDVETGEELHWWEEGGYVGEPVPVEGLLLSLVMDSGRGRSYLVALEAETMQEVARAELPHVVPFGFHGNFFSDPEAGSSGRP